MRPLRIISGILVWAGLAALLYWSVTTQVMSQGRSIRDDLLPAIWSHAAGRHERAELRMDESMWTAVGDPIFIIHNDGTFTQVGEITSIGDITGELARTGIYVRHGSATFYPNAPALTGGSRLTFYETPFSTKWIVDTMLPPERRKVVMDKVREAFETHSDEVLTALRPIVEESIKESLAIVEASLPEVLARHSEKMQGLGGKYQAQIIEKKLVPLVKEEIFPLAMERAKPVANTIGEKLWDRVSVWRFGVRFLWDKTPFADGDSVKREWERFLKEDAVPIIDAHSADLVGVLQSIVSDAAKNKKVQAVFRESIKEVIADRELQSIIWAILREAVLENPKVHAALDKHWGGPRAKAAFALAGDRLEPMVISVGDMLLGTKETGITPELARVLRYRLLHKDSRFYVLESVEAGAGATEAGPWVIDVKMGGEPKVHPFVTVKTVKRE
jgi:hypothetical protein